MIKNNKLIIICVAVALLAFIFACATPRVQTQDEVTFTEYKEIYVVKPKEDPRNVVPQVVSRLEDMGFRVKVLDPETLMEAPQGTGFVVSNQGHILTCAHVLDEEKAATIWLNGKRYEADLIGADEEKDLALLKINPGFNFSAKPLHFKRNPDYRMGEDIYTIGYPMSNILGQAPRLSKGLISATVGLKDDPEQLQISAEIQPGSSGGPLFDKNGMTIGVIQKTLNPIHVLFQTGGAALPQNVNFAMKSHIATQFLEQYKLGASIYAQSISLPFDKAKDSVVQIRAGIIPADSENSQKMIALLGYFSICDRWCRFRVFHIEFRDFETGKLLLKAVHNRDFTYTPEEKVIDAIFKQIREKFFNE
jgi:serine protease Do